MKFESMNLSAPILAAVKKSGYEQPTPIQEKTIPLVLEGKDVLGCAQTGSGKTAAFALPILEKLNASGTKRGAKRPIRALILTPTRELALQIFENFEAYGKLTNIRCLAVYGGVNQFPQTKALERGVDVLVATPGRLNDLMGQGYIHLENVGVFVLDEADRMLDMGFIHDVRRIIRALPEARQTLLFSATMPEEVESLALSILTDPVTVKVDPVTSTVGSIRESLYMVDKVNKKNLLADLLKSDQVQNALVFVRTRHGADKVVKDLNSLGVETMAIHGDKSQAARQEALNRFKSGRIKVLIATDIAARGIDIQGLSHVFNYDLPNEPEAYIHRIGRTGRAGLDGDAVSFCCIDEMKQLSAIQRLLGRRLPRVECPYPMEVFKPTPPRPAREARPEKLGMDGNPLRKPASKRNARFESNSGQKSASKAAPQRGESAKSGVRQNSRQGTGAGSSSAAHAHGRQAGSRQNTGRRPKYKSR